MQEAVGLYRDKQRGILSKSITTQDRVLFNNATKKIKVKRFGEESERVYDCPICKTGEVTVPDDVFFGRCDLCGATLIDYKPLFHQESFHLSNAQYRLNIGGYASGKTTASCAELVQHILTTPNGRSLITAPTLSLVKDAVLPEFNKLLPTWFIEKSRVNPSPYYKLTNGHEVLVYSSQDQENLRSLNLTAFYIEEASGVKYSIFDQLMVRLRHKAGIIKNKKGEEIGYRYIGIISSNPEEGWIQDSFMLKSNRIVGSPSVDTSVYKNLKSKKTNKHFETFLASTRDNTHIPKEYIERASAGKNERWVRKYIDCYLDVREGVVYSDIYKYMVEPFEIPDSWQRIGGFDPGFADPTACLLGAIDPKDGVVYLYFDYSVKEQPISYHAKQLKKEINPYNFFMPIQADPSVVKRNDRDGQTYKDYFYQLTNIVLEPGINDILFGIEKVRDYLYLEKLKIFNNLEHFKIEANKYSYPKADKKNVNDTPIDKYNHLMDCMRYLIARLPQNPKDMESIFMQNYDPFNIFKKKDKQIASAFVGDSLEPRNKVQYGNGIYRRSF